MIRTSTQTSTPATRASRRARRETTAPADASTSNALRDPQQATSSNVIHEQVVIGVAAAASSAARPARRGRPGIRERATQQAPSGTSTQQSG